MPMTVLVPHARGVAALAGVGGVRAVRYRESDPLPEAGRDAEVMVVGLGSVDRLGALMRELPGLRLVQTLNAGTDQWEGRLPEGVALSNARGAHGGSTAEWAAAVLLCIHRELREFAADQTDAAWRPRVTDTLDGKRVLILGAGDLASNLRRRLEPFGVQTTLVGRRQRPGVLAPGDLPELLGEQDAVVVMVPLTRDTRHMVDAAFLARMRDGAILVNASRGPLVDTDALLAELQGGRLRAALDVTEPEPLPPDHPLWRAPGVLITPHVAGSTRGFQDRAWAVATHQIALYAQGLPPENLVS
jgi:phosphoglycerate dehydrogenase-like enzyme